MDSSSFLILGLVGLLAVIVAFAVVRSIRRQSLPPTPGRMNLKQLETVDSTSALSDRDKQIRSWGVGLMLFGVLSLANNDAFLSSTWGLLLIAVGAMSLDLLHKYAIMGR